MGIRADRWQAKSEDLTRQTEQLERGGSRELLKSVLVVGDASELLCKTERVAAEWIRAVI